MFWVVGRDVRYVTLVLSTILWTIWKDENDAEKIEERRRRNGIQTWLKLKLDKMMNRKNCRKESWSTENFKYFDWTISNLVSMWTGNTIHVGSNHVTPHVKLHTDTHTITFLTDNWPFKKSQQLPTNNLLKVKKNLAKIKVLVIFFSPLPLDLESLPGLFKTTFQPCLLSHMSRLVGKFFLTDG